jgi:uridine phosphorylase
MTTHDYPILEFDPARSAVIEPSRTISRVPIPELAVACFFRDIVDDIARRDNLVPLATQHSEMVLHPIYEIPYRRHRLAVFHAGAGAPIAAGLLEGVIAHGARVVVACGGAGVLDPAIPLGRIIVPTAAIRDEGTSYHYLPPSREVAANPRGVEILRELLDSQGTPYLLGKTWTTDALFRETRSKIEARRAEGAITVEMEAAALFAIGEFRDVLVAQLLYAGDCVGGETWDHRDWGAQRSTRKSLFFLACEACCRAASAATPSPTAAP